MNRNSKARNRPIVPMYVAQSQTVPAYISHDDGRKSRCKLVTTMTKRSSHIPMFTIMAMTKSVGTLALTRLDQRNCGVTTLHRMSAQ